MQTVVIYGSPKKWSQNLWTKKNICNFEKEKWWWQFLRSMKLCVNSTLDLNVCIIKGAGTGIGVWGGCESRLLGVVCQQSKIFSFRWGRGACPCLSCCRCRTTRKTKEKEVEQQIRAKDSERQTKSSTTSKQLNIKCTVQYIISHKKIYFLVVTDSLVLVSCLMIK